MNTIHEYRVELTIEGALFDLALYFYETPEQWVIDEEESTWIQFPDSDAAEDRVAMPIPHIVLRLLEKEHDKKVTAALRNRMQVVDEQSQLGGLLP